MSKNQIFNPIRNELIATCLVQEDYRQANGAQSNNKFIVERMQTNPELMRRVVSELGWLATSLQPDLLLPAPDGANWLAEAISLETGIDFGLLHKSDDGTIEPLPDTREKLESADAVVIIEDVLNRLTTTKKVLSMPDTAGKVSAVIGVFDRGPTDRDPLSIPVQALLRLPVPDQLPTDDKLWRLTRSA
jgi:adenine/guanine phosphoribosyltransferase-like PRPP-binding protein